MIATNLNTIARLESYLYRHETFLGFLPLCIGVTHKAWEKLADECSNHSLYKADKKLPMILRFYGIPIIDVSKA